MKRFVVLLAGLVLVAGLGEAAAQTRTMVRVRVVAHDAKIIGSGVGGARVWVRDPATGSVLAAGEHQGRTGDTRALVVDPVVRGEPIYDTEGAGEFTFELDLTQPTVLEFVAEGPRGYPHSMQRASKTMMIVPGEDVLGNGIVLRLHGFIVELLEPGDAGAGSEAVPVRVRIRMMCGCPLEPGGLWDADRLKVTARIYDGDDLVRESELGYAGETNIFAGQISLAGARPGQTLMVVAADPSRQNFGVSQLLEIR